MCAKNYERSPAPWLTEYVQRYRYDENGSGRLHISTYQRALRSPFTSFDGSSTTHRTILEVFIYHTVRETTFGLEEMSSVLSLSYVDEVVSRFLVPPASQSMTTLSEFVTTFGTSLLTLSIAYRISWLRHQIPLTGDYLNQAQLVGHSLGSSIYRRGPGILDPTPSHAPNDRHGLRLLNELYLCACQILLAKIMNPDLTRNAVLIQSEVDRAIQSLASVDLDRHYDAALWPLTMLRLAATGDNAAPLQRALEHFRDPQMARFSRSALTFISELTRQEEQGLIASSFDVLARPQFSLPKIKF